MTSIARLDASLARRGEWITLRRGTGPFTDLPVRANVRAFTPDEITAGVMAGDLKVVLSPTGLDAPAWIAAQTEPAPPAGFNVDRRLPTKGERAIVQGRSRSVEAVMPIRVNDVVVRIEMQVR